MEISISYTGLSWSVAMRLEPMGKSNGYILDKSPIYHSPHKSSWLHMCLYEKCTHVHAYMCLCLLGVLMFHSFIAACFSVDRGNSLLWNAKQYMAWTGSEFQRIADEAQIPPGAVWRHQNCWAFWPYPVLLRRANKQSRNH